MNKTFTGINSALVELSSLLLTEGVWRKTPGFQSENSSRCKELPFPIIVTIDNPQARHVTIPQRKWNRTLPYAESLWIALGSNDLDYLPGKYVNSLYRFSDDQRTWRAGYGPRIREFSNSTKQYDSSLPKDISSFEVDQLMYCVQLLKEEPNTRQALITIHDPIKDSIVGLKTKDQPCTRSLHFMKDPEENSLNMYVHMRSNDLLFGFSAINFFNFSWMQEYVADILGFEVGKYFHMVDNFHYYEDFEEKIIALSKYSLSSAEESDLSQVKAWKSLKETKGKRSTEANFDNSLSVVKEIEHSSFIKDYLRMYKLEELPFFYYWWGLQFLLKNQKEETLSYLRESKEVLDFLQIVSSKKE